MSDAICCFIWMIALLMCLGEPDILDGLIKRANNIECNQHQ